MSTVFAMGFFNLMLMVVGPLRTRKLHLSSSPYPIEVLAEISDCSAAVDDPSQSGILLQPISAVPIDVPRPSFVAGTSAEAVIVKDATGSKLRASSCGEPASVKSASSISAAGTSPPLFPLESVSLPTVETLPHNTPRGLFECTDHPK